MLAVIQRVTKSSVMVDSELVSEIAEGLLVLLGVSRNDSEKDAIYLAEKIPHLRIFEDHHGKMNKSLIPIL